MADPAANLAVAAPPSALDFASLRSEGLAIIRRLAGETWTDHNAHDPGITILEQLCYALTDLAYRAQYDLPDLLASAGEDPYASLYGPAEILPTSPVTLTDLRKLVIDVPGVKNAWIEMVDEPSATFNAAQKEVSHLAPAPGGQDGAAPTSPNVSQIRVKGLYRVRIEKSDLDDIDGGMIRWETALRLHAARGLGQDFHEIKILEFQRVRLAATLEIDAVGDAVALLANVYLKIAAYMSPAVPFRTLGEMLERGRRIDQIFEGPLLEQGFIDSEELAAVERRRSLRVSDLIRELMSVPGVLAVKNLHFLDPTAPDKPSKDWLLDIGADQTPVFDLDNSDIRLEKRGLRVEQGLRAGAKALSVALARKARSPVPAATEPDLRPRRGRDRNVAAYSSVQQQFPPVYGIGPGGLPASARPERKARAKQLKAYLMFYDQLLANEFAQLANAGRLFSFHDASPDSYFSQAVEDGGELGLDELRVSGRKDHVELLRAFTEGDQPGARRRNRFLNHLLARFGEHFRELALLPPAADVKSVLTPEALAERKRSFLRDYPRLSRDRGTGFNYLEPATPDNVSGFERALRHKLGLADPGERVYVVEHVLLRPIAGDALQHGPLFRAAGVRDPYSLQISVVLLDRYPKMAAETREYAHSRGVFEHFKRFAEQTVREETPAHLTQRVVWMAEPDFRAFGAAFAAWLERLRAYRLSELGI